MITTDLYLSLAVGMTLALLFTELFGVLPAGIIVPGYIALSFDQPVMILAIFAISIVTYLIVVHVLSKVTILYGRRKFVAMLLVALMLKLSFDFLYPYVPFEAFEIRGIGAIVPGIIANTMHKQGWLFTMGSTVLLSALTFGVMFAIKMI